jgi:FkbM family methyltransferase
VDIGASGKKNSNSWDLINEGWHGILVEPLPDAAHRCRKEFRGSFKVIEAAVSSHSSPAAEVHISKTRDCSSLNSDWRPDLHTGETIQVPVTTLPRILLSNAVPDRFGVLDVDTEGHDPQVLLPMLRNTQWRPDLIIVEFIDNELYLALLEARYKFVRKFGIDSMWAYQPPTA